jgi:hypothetical protein
MYFEGFDKLIQSEFVICLCCTVLAVTMRFATLSDTFCYDMSACSHVRLTHHYPTAIFVCLTIHYPVSYIPQVTSYSVYSVWDDQNEFLSVL